MWGKCGDSFIVVTYVGVTRHSQVLCKHMQHIINIDSSGFIFFIAIVQLPIVIFDKRTSNYLMLEPHISS